MTQRGDRRAADWIRPGQGRETELRRRPGVREQRTTVLIATNGESTERAYFTALKQEPWVTARVTVVGEKGSPVDLVRGTARRQQRDDFDQAWAVCVVDDFPTRDASAEAESAGVRLAWSNPCFEVWLLLHLIDCAHYVENAKKVRDRLRGQVPGWDKAALDFAVFRDGVEDAVRRSKRLDESPEANPSTAVWQLVEELKAPSVG